VFWQQRVPNNQIPLTPVFILAEDWISGIRVFNLNKKSCY
jgi:hypothetical protein